MQRGRGGDEDATTAENKPALLLRHARRYRPGPAPANGKKVN